MKVQRVQEGLEGSEGKVDGAEGCGIALRAMSILPPAAAKTIQPRLRRAGNAIE